MNSKKNNALRSYLNENRYFFAMMGASVLGDQRSAEYLSKLAR